MASGERHKWGTCAVLACVVRSVPSAVQKAWRDWAACRPPAPSDICTWPHGHTVACGSRRLVKLSCCLLCLCCRWNSWYDLGCSAAMNESTVRATADALVANGLADKGFKYVNLDDCYVKSRLPNGTLVPDPLTFPSGMRSLGNYIHNVSMLFGVYTDRGPMTCAGRPAAQGFEAVDAATYANWTVDYLKEDSVRRPPLRASLPLLPLLEATVCDAPLLLTSLAMAPVSQHHRPCRCIC